MPRRDDRFEAWLGALEARHLADLTFPEVRHGLQALSSLYVERRETASFRSAFEGAGKRAAFAMFFGPLHFLTVRLIVRALGCAESPPARIVDLGSGSGAAGAAWAIEARGAEVLAVDRQPWALSESAWTIRTLGLRGRALHGNVVKPPPVRAGDALLLAFTVNELGPDDRSRLLARLETLLARDVRLLVVEPVSRRVAPWWNSWERAVLAAGGRCDSWSFAAELPERLRLLDRAAGLDHRSLKARSLYVRGAVSDRRDDLHPPAGSLRRSSSPRGRTTPES